MIKPRTKTIANLDRMRALKAFKLARATKMGISNLVFSLKRIRNGSNSFFFRSPLAIEEFIYFVKLNSQLDTYIDFHQLQYPSRSRGCKQCRCSQQGLLELAA